MARVAAHIAALSKHLILVFARRARAIAKASWQLSRRLAQQAYRLYLRFEAAFSDGMADFVLLSWSLRYFFLLVVIQLALIYGVFYFPILWLFAVVILLVLLSASLEVIRDYRAGEIDTPRDYSDSARDLTATIIRWLFRVATAALTVIMLLYAAKSYYSRFGFWPLLPTPRSQESAPESVGTSRGPQAGSSSTDTDVHGTLSEASTTVTPSATASAEVPRAVLPGMFPESELYKTSGSGRAGKLVLTTDCYGVGEIRLYIDGKYVDSFETADSGEPPDMSSISCEYGDAKRLTFDSGTHTFLARSRDREWEFEFYADNDYCFIRNISCQSQ